MKKAFSLLLSLLSFVSLGDDLGPTTELNDVPGNSTLREMFKAGGGDGSATTNDLLDATNLLNRIKRDKYDLAVYEVVRIENTDWTVTSGGEAISDATLEWRGNASKDEPPYVWFLFSDAGIANTAEGEYGRDATNIVFHYHGPYFNTDPVATRPRYIDETYVQAKTNQQLAAVATGDAQTPSDGDLVKYDAANDRFVKAVAGDDYADEATGTDRQIIRGRFNSEDTLPHWVINVNNAKSADRALVSDRTFEVDNTYWTGPWHPTTLSGYGITDGYVAKSEAFTNDVCSVVTNDVIDYTEWTTGGVYAEAYIAYTNIGVRYQSGSWYMHIVGSNPSGHYDNWCIAYDENYISTNPETTELRYVDAHGLIPIRSSRRRNTRNALGLAYLSDIEPLGDYAAVSNAAMWASNEVATIVIPVIDPTDDTFSNAVLAVGLNIDTNSVAVLNEIANTFGGFPIKGTATTVGGLLAALAAAVAWLRKNKVGSFASVGDATATVENGVAKLDDFFTESNSLLTGRVNTLIDAKVGDVNAVLAAALDGTEVA